MACPAARAFLSYPGRIVRRLFPLSERRYAHAGRVQEDFISGVHSGVMGTPSFFVNGLRYEGPTDAFSMISVIETALSPAR